jgi:hypothetical protein
MHQLYYKNGGLSIIYVICAKKISTHVINVLV